MLLTGRCGRIDSSVVDSGRGDSLGEEVEVLKVDRLETSFLVSLCIDFGLDNTKRMLQLHTGVWKRRNRGGEWKGKRNGREGSNNCYVGKAAVGEVIMVITAVTAVTPVLVVILVMVVTEGMGEVVAERYGEVRSKQERDSRHLRICAGMRMALRVATRMTSKEVTIFVSLPASRYVPCPMSLCPMSHVLFSYLGQYPGYLGHVGKEHYVDRCVGHPRRETEKKRSHLG